MADARKTILLRISPDLWAALNTLARDELRSVNAQIEYLLREAVKRQGLLRAAGTNEAQIPTPNSPRTDAPEPTS